LSRILFKTEKVTCFLFDKESPSKKNIEKLFAWGKCVVKTRNTHVYLLIQSIISKSHQEIIE